MKIVDNKNYNQLINKISETYIHGRTSASISVNQHLVNTYWQIGQYIVEFEQGGNIKAEYGKALIDRLSNDLSSNLGKGFSRSNLIYMRLFYLEFPISEKPSHLLSWSHYENTEGDNPPVGIVLTKEKDELLVKYAMHNISSQLFISKYQLYLPDKQMLQLKLKELMNTNDNEVAE